MIFYTGRNDIEKRIGNKKDNLTIIYTPADNLKVCINLDK
jgi:hypothetical protein